MDFVFLHGPPACGKFTVGRELAALTGYKLFHNHLVVNAVRAVYDFGTPGFVALRETLWRESFLRFAADATQLPGVIFTFNPEDTVSQDFIDWIFAKLPSPHLTLLSIALLAPEAELERRLAAPSRHDLEKLTDLALYRQLRTAGNFASPQIPRTDLELDTSRYTPAEAAAAISAFLLMRARSPR